MNNNRNIFAKYYWVILIVVPMVIAAICFWYKARLLNNCELILTYNYQNGFVTYKDTRYAIGKDFCEKIYISEKDITGSFHNLEYYHYFIEADEENEFVIVDSYDDPNFVQIDPQIVDMICKDDSYEKNDSALLLYENNPNTSHVVNLTKIKGTNYYIVTHLLNGGNSERGGTVIGEGIFYENNFIGDIHQYGNLTSVIAYTF